MIPIIYNLTIILSIGGFAACSCLVLYRVAQWVERQGVKPRLVARDLMHTARPLTSDDTIKLQLAMQCKACGDSRVNLRQDEACTMCGTVPAPKDVRTRRFTSFSGAKAKAESQALHEAKQ